MTYEKGQLISYQCAGMPEPRHGIVSNMASHVPDYVFVRFPGEKRDHLTHTSFTRPGHIEAWYYERDGKWYTK